MTWRPWHAGQIFRDYVRAIDELHDRLNGATSETIYEDPTTWDAVIAAGKAAKKLRRQLRAAQQRPDISVD